ncbi:MAG: plasmid pRiA4b ORF-3 family protein [Pseudomonadota bacterium]
MSMTTQIARLRITLEDVEPRVVRRIEVPHGLKLDRLHQVIQAAMPWTNSHLWGFKAGDLTWAEMDLGVGETLPAAKSTLESALKKAGGAALVYTYDFGDDWNHSIDLEALSDPAADVLYPRLLEATGRCPPEDIGGFPGYDRFLEIMADPKDEEYAEMIDIYGEPEDPKVPELDTIQALLNRLARKWKPKPRKAKP